MVMMVMMMNVMICSMDRTNEMPLKTTGCDRAVLILWVGIISTVCNPLEFCVVDGMFKIIKVLFDRYIRDETEMSSSVTRNVGNVTKDTDITFEYGVRPQSSKSLV